jgi:hypothetical protein
MDLGDDSTVWVLGANAKLTMFDPLTFQADLIYGEGENGQLRDQGLVRRPGRLLQFDFMDRFAVRHLRHRRDDEADEDSYQPTLAKTGR